MSWLEQTSAPMAFALGPKARTDTRYAVRGSSPARRASPHGSSPPSAPSRNSTTHGCCRTGLPASRGVAMTSKRKSPAGTRNSTVTDERLISHKRGTMESILTATGVAPDCASPGSPFSRWAGGSSSVPVSSGGCSRFGAVGAAATARHAAGCGASRFATAGCSPLAPVGALIFAAPPATSPLTSSVARLASRLASCLASPVACGLSPPCCVLAEGWLRASPPWPV
mmetsp:Transcript_29546/g.81180  ORF Transcript_29546/g.81180 Transcript_29546/m.81180 type:complete len:226 (-) Transcript_29546:725-1402(-)